MLNSEFRGGRLEESIFYDENNISIRDKNSRNIGNEKIIERELYEVLINKNCSLEDYIISEKQVYKFSESINYEEYSMIKPVACCLHGINNIGIKAGDKVLVLGSGAIGLVMIQLADLAGASFLGISELIEKKRNLAIELGANCALNPLSNNFEKELEKNYGDGPDVIIECTGNKYVIESAFNMAKKGSKVLLFGISNPSTKIEVSPLTILNKELTIKGSFINPDINLDTNEQALDLIINGNLNIKQIINNRFELEGILNSLKIQNEYKENSISYSIAP